MARLWRGERGHKGAVTLTTALEGLLDRLDVAPYSTVERIKEVVLDSVGLSLRKHLTIGEVTDEKVVILPHSAQAAAAIKIRISAVRAGLKSHGLEREVIISKPIKL